LYIYLIKQCITIADIRKNNLMLFPKIDQNTLEIDSQTTQFNDQFSWSYLPPLNLQCYCKICTICN
jgi:hypothetical protein